MRLVSPRSISGAVRSDQSVERLVKSAVAADDHDVVRAAFAQHARYLLRMTFRVRRVYGVLYAARVAVARYLSEIFFSAALAASFVHDKIIHILNVL